ncbi:TPA: hypothetical protein DIV45_01415 [Patescibacteria group bacterium]|uniref:Uncharacterized protein n=1 Tax=Candidatus Woykebacteria bacterium GWA1_44_8 TaxID=1802591 RepID=A0A1G1W4V0_9BACT|nr:MAG: hypothetical protein A2113_00405 [Candidatus Woykebacteria bacterium GWA1_44_8]HCR42007.1 hypothetical protein [Patescibacteria group bacterium]
MLSKISNILFTNQTTSQTIAKNTIWLGTSQIASRLIRAIIVIYAARVLGAYDYGVFAYALGITGLLSILFSDIGVNRILIKQISCSPSERDHYIATVFTIKLCLLSFTALVAAIIAPYFSKLPEANVLLPLLAVLLLSDGIRDFGYAVIRSTEKMQWEAVINLGTNLATVIIAWVALTREPTPMALTTAYVIASLVGTGAILIGLHKTLGKITQYFQKVLIKPVLVEAWPFAVTNLLWSIMMYTDILMLGWLSTAKEVGFYSAAQRPIQLLFAIPAIIAASAFPALSRFAQQDHGKFKQIFEQTLALALLAGLPLMAGGITLGPRLIQLIYGDSYTMTALPLQILASSFIITFPIMVIYHAILANSLQKRFIVQMASGAILNILLNGWFILSWGAAGAATATVISQFIAYGWIYIVVQKIFNFNILQHIYRILLATIVMTIAIELSKLAGFNIYSIIITSVVVYGLSLIVLKEPLVGRIRALWQNSTI